MGHVERLFTRLLARRLHLSEDEVTVDKVAEVRFSDVYPKTAFEVGSAFGGYDSGHLLVGTGEDFDQLERDIDEYMAALRREPADA